MGKYRGGRTPLLAGWALYNHYEAMASRMFAYKPPVSFQAMTQAPPPTVPAGSSRINTKLIFPDDKLRRDLEKHSEHARRLAREGLSPVGQWFTRRPIDHAIARVKAIMREKQVDTKEAILLWDKEYGLELKLQEQEKQILAEDARNSGQAISVMDGMNMLKMIRDMQSESLLKKKQLMDTTVARIQKEKDLNRQSMSSQEQKLAEMTEKLSLAKLKNSADSITGADQELEPVDFDRLIDLDRLQYSHLQLEKRLHSSHLRKIAEALAIQKTLVQIRDIKLEFSPSDAYSIGDQVSPLDFLAAFVRAFEINKISATSAEWGKDRLLYASAYIDGRRAYDVLKEKHDMFKEQFKRFMRMNTVHLEVSQLLNQINLQYDKEAASRGEVTTEVALHQPTNFQDAIAALQPFNWKNYSKLEECQPYMDELFTLLDLSTYLDTRTVERYQSTRATNPKSRK